MSAEVVDLDKVRREVRRARRDGYALAVEEVLAGEVAVGVAIPRPRESVATLHRVVPPSESTPEAFRTR